MVIRDCEYLRPRPQEQCRYADVGAIMNDQSLNLWRQIESCRYCGKKRQWPTVTKRPPKAAAND